MQLFCAPSAGLGRLVGDDEAPWLSLDPTTADARRAQFSVDPAAWELLELAEGEDPLVRLRLERDRRDALRLASILADEQTSQSTFDLAMDAFKALLAQPALLDFVRARANANSALLTALQKAGSAVLDPHAFEAGSSVPSLSSLMTGAAAAKK